jgi:hypothetical protein
MELHDDLLWVAGEVMAGRLEGGGKPVGGSAVKAE